jgi:RNA polymerase sigma-70 factor (ECF subfamily)
MRSAYRRLPRPPDATTARLLRGYVRAWESGDVNALLALLKRDAILEMPPIPDAAVGPAAIRAFLSGPILDGTPDRWRGVTTEANGSPAVGIYQRDGDAYRFTGLHLLTLARDRIAAVTAYMDGSLAARFHLPASIASEPPPTAHGR